MSALLFILPISVLLLAVAIGCFFWAVRRGQFDDLDTPAWQPLLDDDREPPKTPRKKE